MSTIHRSHENVTPRSIEDCPVVTLSKQEFEICRHIAAARTISFRGVSDEPFGSQDQYQAHLTGVLGEAALAQVTRSEMDDAIYVYGDPGHDLELWGHDTDVKCTATHITKPDLIIGAGQDLNAEIYVLAHRISERQIRLLGWAGADTITDRQPQREPGSSLNYIVPFRELDTVPTA
jgi:hypothetical protein